MKEWEAQALRESVEGAKRDLSRTNNSVSALEAVVNVNRNDLDNRVSNLMVLVQILEDRLDALMRKDKFWYVHTPESTHDSVDELLRNVTEKIVMEVRSTNSTESFYCVKLPTGVRTLNTKEEAEGLIVLHGGKDEQ